MIQIGLKDFKLMYYNIVLVTRFVVPRCGGPGRDNYPAGTRTHFDLRCQLTGILVKNPLTANFVAKNLTE